MIITRLLMEANSAATPNAEGANSRAVTSAASTATTCAEPVPHASLSTSPRKLSFSATLAADNSPAAATSGSMGCLDSGVGSASGAAPSGVEPLSSSARRSTLLLLFMLPIAKGLESVYAAGKYFVVSGIGAYEYPTQPILDRAREPGVPHHVSCHRYRGLRPPPRLTWVFGKIKARIQRLQYRVGLRALHPCSHWVRQRGSRLCRPQDFCSSAENHGWQGSQTAGRLFLD